MRILLIEDEPLLGEAVQEHIAAAGHAVDRVTRIDEARGALQAVDYALVLLDLHLPDGRGLDLLKALRRSADLTPVIILTADSTINSAVQAMKLGAYDYLVKPFELDKMLETIKGEDINLLAFSGFPAGGGKSQLDFVAEDPTGELFAPNLEGFAVPLDGGFAFSLEPAGLSGEVDIGVVVAFDADAAAISISDLDIGGRVDGVDTRRPRDRYIFTALTDCGACRADRCRDHARARRQRIAEPGRFDLVDNHQVRALQHGDIDLLCRREVHAKEAIEFGGRFGNGRRCLRVLSRRLRA